MDNSNIYNKLSTPNNNLSNRLLRFIWVAFFLFTIPPIGGSWGGYAYAQWKNYLSYYTPTEIEQAGDGTLYVLASGDIYSYNPTDQSITTYDKVNGLSDCGISHIAWCETAKRLVIVYDDYNIDLLSSNGNITNMPAYMNASMTDDKTVNSISISGRYAYLSTGFGIIQLNVSDASFTNTYRLGFNVNYSYVQDGYLYAERWDNTRRNNIVNYRGLLTSNLVDPNQWERQGSGTRHIKSMDSTLLATVNTLNPGGPKYNYFGQILFKYGNLYSVSGGYLMGQDDKQYPGYYQVLRSNGEWNVYGENLQTTTGHAYVDIMCINVDPSDTSHIFIGGRTGLYEFYNGNFTKEYTVDSNPQLPSMLDGNKNYLLITGLLFDESNNLWILDNGCKNYSVFKLTPDNTLESYHSSLFITPNNNTTVLGITSPIIDSRGILWFANQHYWSPGLYGINTNNKQQAYAFTSITNEDETTYESSSIHGVSAVVEDKDNNIWIGSQIGPFMLEENQIDNSNPIFTQVKVPRDDGTDYADYLLSNVDIRSIIIDNSNRKWFGTNGNGLYLISSNNLNTIEHFTKDNSPLLSDNIQSMALDETTGELYIGTDNGLCSYKYTMPNPGEGMTKDNVYAYPNPVRPDYKGAITITGLDDDADVKITTSSGELVNEGKSSNGKYKWYGIDNNGKQVASGIYMVAVATAEGNKGVVCKIAIVR